MKKLLLLSLLLCAPLGAAVQYAGSANAYTSSPFVSNLTYSFTSDNGSTQDLFVVVDNNNCTSASFLPSSVTWGGAAFTLLTSTAIPIRALYNTHAVYYLLNNAASSTANIVVSFSAGGVGVGGIQSSAYEYLGWTPSRLWETWR